MRQRAGFGGTALGQMGSQHVPCVLEEGKGVTLRAPEVKLQGSDSNQQLAQIFF